MWYKSIQLFQHLIIGWLGFLITLFSKQLDYKTFNYTKHEINGLRSKSTTGVESLMRLLTEIKPRICSSKKSNGNS